MSNRTRRALLSAVAVAPLLCIFSAAPAAAQPAQMCGDGTTFSVVLPHVATGTGGHDTIEVPRGCSIYLIIASDYGRNREFNELLFYPLAKYVAENNGYVHYSWWNNFLKPYMGGVLHSKDKPTDPGPKATVGQLGSVFGLNVPVGLPGHDEVYVNDLIAKMRGGGLGALWEQFTVMLASSVVTVPTDQQFVSDAGAFIQAVRTQSPNALVFLAGHGFGAHAIVKVAKNPSNTIDLLAPIAPIGNETQPVGYRQLFEPGMNPFIDEVASVGTYGHVAPHTRWRAVFDFKGYQSADCVRGGGLLGNLCRDFDPRLLYFNYHCISPNPSAWQPTTPLVWTFRPVSCPGPLVDPGTRISFGSNVGFLYHRYQMEWGPPIDFGTRHHYGFRSPVTRTLQGPNVQGPILPDDVIVFPGSTDPHYIEGRSTCRSFPDRDDCQAADGHDEIAGFRGEPTFNLGGNVVLTLTASGVKARDWPGDPVSEQMFVRTSDSSPHAAARREAMLEMASTTINVTDFDCAFGASIPGAAIWARSPCTPSDCLVCEDLVEIAANLVAGNGEENPSPGDTAAPTTLATIDPAANVNGWLRTDATVTLQASDNPGGSGVKEIQYSTPDGTALQPGSTAHAVITAEGTTLLSYFATDNANNIGALGSIELKIDKTLPQIDAVTSTQPNADGWFRTAVSVAFPAFDLLSGLASTTPDILVTTEGAEQEVAGTASDKADNHASASVLLNIDMTAPTMTFTGMAPPANAAGWHAGGVTLTWSCTDGLSGPRSQTVTQSLTSEGAQQAAAGTCIDFADNVATDTKSGINIDTTPPSANISTPADGSVLLLNSQVPTDYACSDALSGVHSCTGSVPAGTATDTSTVGGKTFTVQAVDAAGNQAAAQTSYSVQYAFSGFASPIQAWPVANPAVAGKAVVLKFSLADAAGAAITDLGVLTSAESYATACEAPPEGVPPPEMVDTPVSQFTYNPNGGLYAFAWKTQAGWTGCRILQLTLKDGTVHSVLFSFGGSE